MVSNINPLLPLNDVPAVKQDLRNNLAAAKAEIEALQEAVADPAAGGNVDPTTFGVVGDGSTDDSTALIAMRDAIIASGKPATIVFEAGMQVAYSNNRWLKGIDATVVGYGCSFWCTSNVAWGENQIPIQVGDPFDNTGDAVFTNSPNPKFAGHRINTAAKGATTVTLTTAGDASNYPVGTRVLVYGYDQQPEGSYPPNPRYFDYAQVIAASGAVLTLNRTLSADYDARWPDITNAWDLVTGKPRILSLDRAQYRHARWLVFRGGEYKANPINGAWGFIASADYLRMEDVTTRSVVITCCRAAEMDRCDIRYIEIDKVIEKMTISNSTIAGETPPPSAMGGATDCKHLTLHNIRTDWINPLHPQNLTIDACTIGAMWSLNTYFPIKRLTVRDTLFDPGPDWDNVAVLEQGAVLSLTVGTIGNPDSKSLIFPYNPTDGLLRNLQVGSVMRATGWDGTPFGTVTAIYHDGGSPGNIIVEGTWDSGDPVADATWFWRAVEYTSDGGGNTRTGPGAIFSHTPDYP